MAYTTIDDPSAHFQTTLWTGDGSSPRTITNDGNSNLQPDLVWHKNRSDSGRSHYLHDSSRGFGSEKELSANTDDNENSNNHLVENHGYIASVSTDSFVLGAGATNDVYTNNSSSTYVAWQWKANGGTTTTNDASATSIGSIDSVYQANTTARFSIVTYTGTGSTGTIAHGLGAVPSVIFIKRRDSAGDWTSYHSVLGDEKYMRLNSTNAMGDQATYFNDTTPTSTVFTVGSAGDVNTSSGTHVAYCFAEIQGYSKFGSYTGNGNADGPFVYTGFKPALVMIKCTSQTESWFINDTTRSVDNPTLEALIPNQDAVENTTDGYSIDILSNGFKCRADSGQQNEDDGTYVYMAFAEHPFVSSEGVPCTAR